MVSRSWIWPTVLASLAALATAATVACNGDDSGASQESEVISAVYAIDNAGLHGIDESINNNKDVPNTAHTTAVHLQTVVKLTDWPKELDDDAGKLEQTLGDLAAALDTDNPDLAKAGELASLAHEEAHDLSHGTWAWLEEQAGVEAAAE